MLEHVNGYTLDLSACNGWVEGSWFVEVNDRASAGIFRQPPIIAPVPVP